MHLLLGKKTRRLLLAIAPLLSIFAASPCAAARLRDAHIRDIAEIEGVRENQLIGYGLVVGLQGTGDRQQTYFTVQTLANMLERLGIQIPTGTTIIKNVAAVMVTAKLPSFSEPGMKIDVTVSSVGDAKSIEGGVLLLTALRGPDGQVYAEAQGALTTGGYSQEAAGNVREVNYPTVGLIAEGAIVERSATVDLHGMRTLSFLLRNADFTTAREMTDAINKEFNSPVATLINGREIDVNAEATGIGSIPRLISRIQELSVPVDVPARVVVNERTGTIVLGGDVLLSPVSVLHGGLQVQVDTVLTATQAAPGSSAAPVVVTNTTLNVQDREARSIHLGNGADVEELVKGLHTIGATGHDIISILEAIKSAGGLQADLEVI
ncbi:MAG TPA: flagellar basal body P-ring protein FlgI [Acidobacteriaceae bacterium]|jgi:flagellar P-ring protein precursor FlgI